MVSCAPVAGDNARKYKSEVPAAKPAGTDTTAQTVALAPALTVPVLVIVAPVVEQLPAPPSALNVTVQPAGII